MRSRPQTKSTGNSNRTKSPSSATSSPNSAVQHKKSGRLPLISGLSDDSINQSSNILSSGLIVGVCSQQGKRPYQEDEYCVQQYLNQLSPTPGEVETHFFGLFDGHAGGKCSKHISSILPAIIAEDANFGNNLPSAIKRSFHSANEQFLKIAEKMKLHDGSTGICSIVRDNKILVANVGDCRTLILSGGRPIQMSIDQKPTNPDEQKRIAALGGAVVYCMGVARVNRVLAVSRAFGNRTLKSVIRPDAEMMQRELTKEDEFLIMASDGLWDVLRNKDVCDICYSSQLYNSSPQLIADELVQTALVRGSMDNVTCIVVKLKDYVNRMLNSQSRSFKKTSSSPSIEEKPASSNLAPSQSLTNSLNSPQHQQAINSHKLDRTYSGSMVLNNSVTGTGNDFSASPTTRRQHGLVDGSNNLFSTENLKGIPTVNNNLSASMPNKQMSLGSMITPDKQSNHTNHQSVSNSTPQMFLRHNLSSLSDNQSSLDATTMKNGIHSLDNPVGNSAKLNSDSPNSSAFIRRPNSGAGGKLGHPLFNNSKVPLISIASNNSILGSASADSSPSLQQAVANLHQASNSNHNNHGHPSFLKSNSVPINPLSGSNPFRLSNEDGLKNESNTAKFALSQDQKEDNDDEITLAPAKPRANLLSYQTGSGDINHSVKNLNGSDSLSSSKHFGLLKTSFTQSIAKQLSLDEQNNNNVMKAESGSGLSSRSLTSSMPSSLMSFLGATTSKNTMPRYNGSANDRTKDKTVDNDEAKSKEESYYQFRNSPIQPYATKKHNNNTNYESN